MNSDNIDKTSTFLVGVLILTLLMVFGAYIRVMTDEVTPIEKIKEFGYTNIQIGKYAWLGCSRDDSYRKVFTATDREGNPMKGLVCGSLYGYSIRKVD